MLHWCWSCQKAKHFLHITAASNLIRDSSSNCPIMLHNLLYMVRWTLCYILRESNNESNMLLTLEKETAKSVWFHLVHYHSLVFGLILRLCVCMVWVWVSALAQKNWPWPSVASSAKALDSHVGGYGGTASEAGMCDSPAVISCRYTLLQLADSAVWEGEPKW